MNVCPCKTCHRKGCGSFHSQCKLYTNWHTEQIRQSKDVSERYRELAYIEHITRRVVPHRR